MQSLGGTAEATAARAPCCTICMVLPPTTYGPSTLPYPQVEPCGSSG